MVIKETLGMPYGTACARLRKIIMFNLVVESKKDICFKCNLSILNADEFSIEHKLVWEGISAELFWDLNNITFSHRACNRPERQSRGLRKIGEEGTAWCGICQEFKSIKDFHKNKTNWNGVAKRCKVCVKINDKRKLKKSNNYYSKP